MLGRGVWPLIGTFLPNAMRKACSFDAELDDNGEALGGLLSCEAPREGYLQLLGDDEVELAAGSKTRDPTFPYSFCFLRSSFCRRIFSFAWRSSSTSLLVRCFSLRAWRFALRWFLVFFDEPF